MVSMSGLFSSLLLLSTVIAAPLPMSSQVEILRISGVAESDIEHTLNPNHVLASAYESHIQPSPQHTIALRPSSSSSEFQFTQAIDGYSTAKLSPDSPSPASASLGNLAISVPVHEATSQGAFDRVRKWILNRDPSDEGAMFVTGRMGEIKVRGR